MNKGMVAKKMLLLLFSFLLKSPYHFWACQPHFSWLRRASFLGSYYACELAGWECLRMNECPQPLIHDWWVLAYIYIYIFLFSCPLARIFLWGVLYINAVGLWLPTVVDLIMYPLLANSLFCVTSPSATPFPWNSQQTAGAWNLALGWPL